MREVPRPDGPGRPLSEAAARLAARAALTDRPARFAARFAEIERAEGRRRSRERAVERATVVALVVGLPVVGAWMAVLLGSPAGTGLAGGVVVGVAVVLLRRWLSGYATRRGATAWDWQRRRHVARGHPSRSVQDMTGPRSSDRR